MTTSAVLSTGLLRPQACSTTDVTKKTAASDTLVWILVKLCVTHVLSLSVHLHHNPYPLCEGDNVLFKYTFVFACIAALVS